MGLITRGTIREKIDKLREIELEVARFVVLFCKQQVELWKQVPYLSLMATRREHVNAGYGDEVYEYKHCLKILEGPPNNVAIDLLTGDIIHYDRGRKLQPVDIRDVRDFLKKHFMALSYFDAEIRLDELKEKVKNTPDKNKDWRNKKLQELKLEEISTKRHSMPTFSCF